MFRHSKWLMFAVLAVGLAAVAGGALYAAKLQDNLPLHVAKVLVTFTVFSTGGPSGFHDFTVARVDIVDEGGQPVSGARVTGKFIGCEEQYSASGRTDASGVVVIRGHGRKCGCVQTFTVTGVTKSGWSWNPPDPLPSDSRCLCGCD